MWVQAFSVILLYVREEKKNIKFGYLSFHKLIISIRIIMHNLEIINQEATLKEQDGGTHMMRFIFSFALGLLCLM